MAISKNKHQSTLSSIHPKENLTNHYGSLAYTRGTDIRILFFKSKEYLLRPAIATWQRKLENKMRTGGIIVDGSHWHYRSGFPLLKREL